MPTDLITQTVVTAIVTSLVSFLFTPLSMLLARKFRVIDAPQSHKLHKTSTPLMGGVAMWVAFVLGLLIFGRGEASNELAAIIGGGTLIAGVGLIDDRFTLNPGLKLFGQFLAALVLVLGGVSGDLFPSFPILNASITIAWVIAIVNALNLQDNIDGLAAGLAATAAMSFLILAVLHNQYLIAILSATLLGACVGFLTYNFQPAITFMGDTGSLLLGFILSILGLKINFPEIQQSQTWLIPIMVLGIPIFDTLLVMVSRTRRGVPIWRGGTDHTSHRLVRLGLSHRRAVVTLYLVSFALGSLAIIVVNATTTSVAWWTVTLLVVSALLLIALLEYAISLDTPTVNTNLRVLYLPGAEQPRDVLQGVLKAASKVTVLLNDASESEQSPALANTLIAAASNDEVAVSQLLIQKFEQGVQFSEKLEWARRTLQLNAEFVSRSTLEDARSLRTVLKQYDLILLSGGYETNIRPLFKALPLADAIIKSKVSVIEMYSNSADLAYLNKIELNEVVGAATPPTADNNSDQAVAMSIKNAWVTSNNSRRLQVIV